MSEPFGKNPASAPSLSGSGGFARRFKFTLIHPALSLALFGAAAIWTQAQGFNILCFGLVWSGLIINLPGVLMLKLLGQELSRPAYGAAVYLALATALTWALIVAAAWLCFKCRRR